MNGPQSVGQPNRPFSFTLQGDVLLLRGALILPNVEHHFEDLRGTLKNYPTRPLTIDLDELEALDSSGVAALQVLMEELKQRGISVTLSGGKSRIRKTFEVFSRPEQEQHPALLRPTGLERWGEAAYHFFTNSFLQFLFLASDIFFWSWVDIFKRKAHRKGEFINQAVLIGVNAVPIVGLIAFLIGLILALQSAEQLRQFGANIFIVDLIVIAMTREMGPLLTAIMIAGRSGSAIASEIATMVVTEEVDALKTMGLNPVRYIVIPKLHASVLTLPFLTIMADLLGILGGIVIAYLQLDLSPDVFLRRTAEILYFRDIVTGSVKSLIFAGLIVLSGSFFGFRVKGGPEGVGRVTTAAVVASIFLVIAADSILSLFLY